LPRLKTAYGDSLSDVGSAATSLTLSERTSAQVRAAQLVLTSVAMDDIVSLDDALRDRELQTEIREVLEAVGIFNRDGKVITARSKPMIGLVRSGGHGSYRGRRELNGRPSRAKGIYQK
jgi:hypothetical protein